MSIKNGRKKLYEFYSQVDYKTQWAMQWAPVRATSTIFWKISKRDYGNFSKNNWIRQGRKQAYNVALIQLY